MEDPTLPNYPARQLIESAESGERALRDHPVAATVAICTRDRPSDLRRAIASVLRSDFPDFDLLVIDQSTSPRTERIIVRFRQVDRRVRYLRSERTGLSIARNLAMTSAGSELVVFTDDDCVVERGWLGTMVRVLEADNEAGLAWGEVIPARDVSSDGFIVGCHIERFAKVKGRRFFARSGGGIGANMAVRRDAWQAVGGFDEVLGAGSYFPSCEDGDFACRLLRTRYAVLQVPAAAVVHYGLRDWATGSTMIRNTYLAVAAAYVKHVRCGDLFGVWLIAQQILSALTNLVSRLLRWKRPFGFGRLAYLLLGIVRSFERKVDRRQCLYR